MGSGTTVGAVTPQKTGYFYRVNGTRKRVKQKIVQLTKQTTDKKPIQKKAEEKPSFITLLKETFLPGLYGSKHISPEARAAAERMADYQYFSAFH